MGEKMNAYIDGQTIKECKRIREIEEKNFSPMIVNSNLWEDFKKTYIQVEINFLGFDTWINVLRSKVIVK